MGGQGEWNACLRSSGHYPHAFLQISLLTKEKEDGSSHLSSTREKLRVMEEKLVVLQDESRDELDSLTNQLHNKSKAGVCVCSIVCVEHWLLQ